MSSVSVFVGLDDHAASVQVCVLDREGNVLVNRKCPNNASRIAGCVRAAAPAGTTVFAAIEACTGVANLAEELIAQAGWSGHLAAGWHRERTAVCHAHVAKQHGHAGGPDALMRGERCRSC